MRVWCGLLLGMTICLSTGCAASRHSAREACERLETLRSQPSPRPRHFAPWQVDRLATPLPREAAPLAGTPHDLLALTTAGEPASGVLVASVALFYTAFRRTWGKFDMTRCDLHPSCSRFALEATREAPLWAIPLTFARVMRNHEGPLILRDEQGKKRDDVRRYTMFLGDEEARLPHDDPHREAERWFLHVEGLERGCAR